MKCATVADRSTGGGNDNLPLKPTGIFVLQRDHSATWADLPQWYVLGAQCWRCAEQYPYWHMFKYGQSTDRQPA